MAANLPPARGGFQACCLVFRYLSLCLVMNRKAVLPTSAVGVVVALVVASSAGCGASRGTVGAAYAAKALRAQELGALPEASAYEAVERMRPQFLWSRPAASDSQQPAPAPCAIVDGGIPADVHGLRGLMATQVLEIVSIAALDAYQRYGPACAHGALVVTTRAKATTPT